MNKGNLTIGTNEKVTLDGSKLWAEFHRTGEGRDEISIFADIVYMSDSLKEKATDNERSVRCLTLAISKNGDRLQTEILVAYNGAETVETTTIPIDLTGFETELKGFVVDGVKDILGMGVDKK